eukprot:13215674-Alexandrium_andersonii.AAC.1
MAARGAQCSVSCCGSWVSWAEKQGPMSELGPRPPRGVRGRQAQRGPEGPASMRLSRLMTNGKCNIAS